MADPNTGLAPDAERTRALYALLADHSTELIGWHSPADGAFRYASPASRRVLGYEPEALTGLALTELAHPDDAGAVRAALATAGDRGESDPVSYRARHRDGRTIWLETTHRALPAGPPGCGPGILSVSREITKFKELERAIERVAQEWRGTFDAASDVIILLDDELRVARANRAAVGFFDRPFPDLLWHPVVELLRALEPRRGVRLPAVRRLRRRWEREVYLAARESWVLLSLDPIRDAAGQPAGAVHVIRDITERKRAEIALRDSLERLRELSARLESAREQERTRIAREIHDELGHALTALKMDVAWLVARLGPEPELAERGRSMSALIDRTIATIRDIATELRPSILDDLGLLAAIEWAAAEFGRRTGIATRVRGPEGTLDLDPERATAVFRIVQEALTNVARHAGARAVEVSLREAAGGIVLEVADDGRGVTAAEIAGGGALGILGMRERARIAGARMTLEGRPGAGTTLRLHVPRDGGAG